MIRELTYAQQFLLDTVTTPGEMGTVANWQQHLFPLLLDPSEQAIVQATGAPLSGKATLPREYPGDPRFFVPVVRTLLVAGESLPLDAIVVGIDKPVRDLPLAAAGRQQIISSVPLAHVERGVYRTVLPAREIPADFEYYVEVTDDRKSLRFPPTAPELNQTVVLVDKAE